MMREKKKKKKKKIKKDRKKEGEEDTFKENSKLFCYYYLTLNPHPYFMFHLK